METVTKLSHYSTKKHILAKYPKLSIIHATYQKALKIPYTATYSKVLSSYPSWIMKKTFSFVLVMSLFFLLGCTKQSSPTIVPTAPTTPTTSLEENIPTRQTYESKIDGFLIQFPSTWTAQEKVYGSSVTFNSPTNETDKIKENVAINTTKLNNTYTIDEYFTANKERLIAQTGYVEIENSTIKINEMDAKKIIFKSIYKDYKLQFEEIFIIKHTTLYTITYTATEATFNDFAKQVDEMIATFEIK
jgi:hypothetical protein